MKVISKLIFDAETFDTVYSQCEEYEGPVSLCGGGGGGGKSARPATPPPPTVQETAPARETGETPEQRAERNKRRKAALAAGQPDTILSTLGTPATTQTGILGG